MNYTILIADDNKELVKMLKSYLELKGYRVIVALDGAEALRQVEQELDARITAHLKREERHRVKSHYRFWGELSIDYTARSVQVRESCVELTKMEYDIIEFLSMHPGQVFDRERMYERICGYEAEGDSRVITELVRRIRKKLQQYTDTEYIETVWGMGYRWRRERKL